MKKYKGISRIDSGHTHGWYVRVYANRTVFTSKLFSDKLYGGKQIALDNAIKYRDHNQMVANVKYPPQLTRMKYREVPPSDNKSGIVGVHFTNKLERGKRIPTWVATWVEDRKNKSKAFYQRKFRTLEEAFDQAVEFRKQKIQEIKESLN